MKDAYWLDSQDWAGESSSAHLHVDEAESPVASQSVNLYTSAVPNRCWRLDYSWRAAGLGPFWKVKEIGL